MRHFSTLLAALIATSILAFQVGAQSPTDEQSNMRFQQMLDQIKAIEIQPDSTGSNLASTIHTTPILRFGDAARDTADGAIWKSGNGRPEVLLATEHVLHDGIRQLSIEFLCLTDQKFTLHTEQGWEWAPANSAIRFVPLDDVPAPQESATRRALQTRQLARRFSASQLYQGEFFRLRMLPNPIDQYKIRQGDTEHDGAIFAFANGTNPEVLLFLETTDDRWQYGLARMCGAEPSVKFDDREVWKLPPMSELGKSWQLNYTGDVLPLE